MTVTYREYHIRILGAAQPAGAGARAVGDFHHYGAA